MDVTGLEAGLSANDVWLDVPSPERTASYCTRAHNSARNWHGSGLPCDSAEFRLEGTAPVVTVQVERKLYIHRYRRYSHSRHKSQADPHNSQASTPRRCSIFVQRNALTTGLRPAAPRTTFLPFNVKEVHRPERFWRRLNLPATQRRSNEHLNYGRRSTGDGGQAQRSDGNDRWTDISMILSTLIRLAATASHPRRAVSERDLRNASETVTFSTQTRRVTTP